jgi:LacI family transcriptional regulator
VAAEAGVSIKTVSRVLNAEGYVSDATRAAVRKAIEDLSYRPNPAAQGLRRSMSRSIAVVVEDIAEPFASQVIQAVEIAVAQRSTVIIASSLGDPSREREVLESLTARQVDGVILSPTTGSKSYLCRLLGRTALVCLDRPAPGFAADLVATDNVGGMRTAVDHLLERGHRRVAYLGDDQGVFTQTERLQGYRAALTDADIAVDERLIYQHVPDRERIGRHLRWLASMPDPPTAFVSGNSLTTFEMMHAGLDAGSASFVAFDDFPLSDVVNGGVSVVAQDATALGTECVQTLERRIANDDAPVRTTRMGTRLILRGRDTDRSTAQP